MQRVLGEMGLDELAQGLRRVVVEALEGRPHAHGAVVGAQAGHPDRPGPAEHAPALIGEQELHDEPLAHREAVGRVHQEAAQAQVLEHAVDAALGAGAADVGVALDAGRGAARHRQARREQVEQQRRRGARVEQLAAALERLGARAVGDHGDEVRPVVAQERERLQGKIAQQLRVDDQHVGLGLLQRRQGLAQARRPDRDDARAAQEGAGVARQLVLEPRQEDAHGVRGAHRLQGDAVAHAAHVGLERQLELARQVDEGDAHARTGGARLGGLDRDRAHHLAAQLHRLCEERDRELHLHGGFRRQRIVGADEQAVAGEVLGVLGHALGGRAQVDLELGLLAALALGRELRGGGRAAQAGGGEDQRARRGDERLGVHRLGKHVADGVAAGRQPLVVPGERADAQHREVQALRPPAQLLRQVEAAHARKEEIDDDQVDLAVPQGAQRHLAGAEARDGVASLHQGVAQHGEHELVVIH